MSSAAVCKIGVAAAAKIRVATATNAAIRSGAGREVVIGALQGLTEDYVAPPSGIINE